MATDYILDFVVSGEEGAATVNQRRANSKGVVQFLWEDDVSDTEGDNDKSRVLTQRLREQWEG